MRLLYLLDILLAPVLVHPGSKKVDAAARTEQICAANRFEQRLKAAGRELLGNYR